MFYASHSDDYEECEFSPFKKQNSLSLNVRWISSNGSLCPWEPGKEENTINQWFPNVSLNAII